MKRPYLYFLAVSKKRADVRWGLDCKPWRYSKVEVRRSDNSLVSDSSIEAIKGTKRLFSRLRIPLAKLEPEQRHKADDYQVPLPGIGPEGLG
jgi:hypothetical protein